MDVRTWFAVAPRQHGEERPLLAIADGAGQQFAGADGERRAHADLRRLAGRFLGSEHWRQAAMAGGLQWLLVIRRLLRSF